MQFVQYKAPLPLVVDPRHGTQTDEPGAFEYVSIPQRLHFVELKVLVAEPAGHIWHGSKPSAEY